MIASKHSIDDIQLIGGADVMAGKAVLIKQSIKWLQYVCTCVRACISTLKLLSYDECSCPAVLRSLNQLKKLSVYMV